MFYRKDDKSHCYPINNPRGPQMTGTKALSDAQLSVAEKPSSQLVRGSPTVNLCSWSGSGAQHGKPALSPSPSLRPISSTALRVGGLLLAGTWSNPAALRPAGALRQRVVKRHASCTVGLAAAGGGRVEWERGHLGYRLQCEHTAGAATASREGLRLVLGPASQAPARCGLVSYKWPDSSSGRSLV